MLGKVGAGCIRSILKFVPWAIAAIALVACGATYSELQRVRARFGEVTAHKFRDHSDVREFMIRAAIAEAQQPIVVIGDSITEMAPFSRQICGHTVVNAGVGGMTIREAKRLVGPVLDERGAFLVVLTVGANDAASPRAREDFAALIEATKPLSARPLVAATASPNAQTNREIGAAAAAAGVHFVDPELPPGSKMADGIHYTARGYSAWLPAIEAAIAKECE